MLSSVTILGGSLFFKFLHYVFPVIQAGRCICLFLERRTDVGVRSLWTHPAKSIRQMLDGSGKRIFIAKDSLRFVFFESSFGV